MQETVTEKPGEGKDKQMHSNPITGPAPSPGNLPENNSAELEPTISQEEFDTLEKAEGKKKLFGFLKGMNKPKSRGDSESGSSNDNGVDKKLSDLMLKIEKLEGKFEMLDSSKSEHGDRMSNISEEIGELRSMIFAREETLGTIETEFKNIKEATSQIRPEKISKELESYSKDLMKAQAGAELEKSKVEQLEGELQKITKILEKIKSYENILDATKDIKKQVDKIKSSEKYTERMAAKAEKIFGELDNRLIEFQKYKKEIEDSNEMIKDVVKSLDGLDIKIESMLPKDSFSKAKEETETKFKDVDTRLKRLKDIVSEVIDRSYSHKNIQADDLDAFKSSMHDEIISELSKMESRFEEIRKTTEARSEELEQKIHGLSGELSSLESKTESQHALSVAGTSSGFSRIDSMESKIRDQSEHLEKEIRDAVGSLGRRLDSAISSEESLSDRISYLKDSIDHQKMPSPLDNPALVREFSKRDARSEDLEQKIRSLSGELLSLESKTESENVRSAVGIASGLSRIASLESRVRDQSAILEKEIHDSVGTLAGRLDSAISSEESLDDRIGYLKDSIDHQSMPSPLDNPALVREFSKRDARSEDLEQKIRSLSGALLSLQSKTESETARSAAGMASGLSQISSLESRVRDQSAILEKEIHDSVGTLGRKLDSVISSEESLDDRIGYLKDSMDHQSIPSPLDNPVLVREFSKRDARSGDLEQKIHSLSGALLSLESKTESESARSAAGTASGLSRIASLESRVRDQSAILEKEIHDSVGTLAGRLDSVISSEESLDDRIGYLKDSIDHAGPEEFAKSPGIMTKPAVKNISPPVAGNSTNLTNMRSPLPSKNIEPHIEKHDPVTLPAVSLNPSTSLQIVNDFRIARNMDILFDQLEKQSHAEKPVAKAYVSASASSSSPSEKSSAFASSKKITSSQSPRPPLIPSAAQSKSSPASSVRSPSQSLSRSTVPLDIGSRINSLKMLIAEKEKNIDLSEAGGSSVSEERILIDNASLHLGMAELDFLDGNEGDSLQKIEKVKALLEK